MNSIFKTQEWQTLLNHHKAISSARMIDLFKEDKNRFNRFSLSASPLFLDYSKNRITTETIDLLCDLAKKAGLHEKINAMFSGNPINETENRSVLHTALRNRSGNKTIINGENITDNITYELDMMRQFVRKVRSGEWLGHTGKPVTDVVNIGIGGSDLGPKMVCKGLRAYANSKLRTHFVSNVDGAHIVTKLNRLNPETTLFIVASKTFSTKETLMNAEAAKSWIVSSFGDETSVAKHFVALSTNTEKVQAFGIDTLNMFKFWDWVGGRYSLWSVIGLSIALLIGMEGFEALLSGGFEMDQHFKNSDFKENMPVILGLLGVWYRNAFGFNTHAVIPYSQYLKYFPAFLQQMDMESNGKSVSLNGEQVDYKTGPVIWGGVGTDSQHSFHQLLHQGTDIVPIDFIIPTSSINALGNHHSVLYANCLAQAQALLIGKSEEEAYLELKAKGLSEKDARKLSPHKIMPGNRPSNMLLIEKITPKSLGNLIALYEHKVFVQGVIWNINSFDQWGVEYGKDLAVAIVPSLNGKAIPEKYDGSTKGLIEKYRKTHG